MGQAYDFETREYAEDLYITRGYTLEKVAVATGVSLQQIKTWSSDDRWVERRTEYRQAIKDIRSNTIRLRRELIAKALQSKDPQDVYAAAAIERIAAMAERRPGSPVSDAVPAPGQLREIVTPQDAIGALQEAVQYKINLLLSNPESLNLAAIKDMKQAFALIDDLKARYKPDDKGKGKGLSDEAAEEIRRKILGIK
jgi:sulfur transfer complex TusBCD TusB component (DsrH family)